MAKDLFPSPHPLTPPHEEDDRRNWLRLLRSRRVGPATFFRLMTEHGSAAAALAALPDIAAAAGVSDYAICPDGVVAAELKAGRLAGATLVAYGEADYPQALYDLSDAPPLLWIFGDRTLLRRPMVALVGARNASSLGTRMARKLAAGHPFDARASGCNMLLRDGATLVRSVEDVLEVVGSPRPVAIPTPGATPDAAVTAAAPRSLAEMSALHSQILSRLGPSPVAEDQLIRDLRLSARDVAPELVSLELEGRIIRQTGGLVALAS